jgi:hypothetical protein
MAKLRNCTVLDVQLSYWIPSSGKWYPRIALSTVFSWIPFLPALTDLKLRDPSFVLEGISKLKQRFRPGSPALRLEIKGLRIGSKYNLPDVNGFWNFCIPWAKSLSIVECDLETERLLMNSSFMLPLRWFALTHLCFERMSGYSRSEKEINTHIRILHTTFPNLQVLELPVISVKQLKGSFPNVAHLTISDWIPLTDHPDADPFGCEMYESLLGRLQGRIGGTFPSIRTLTLKALRLPFEAGKRDLNVLQSALVVIKTSTTEVRDYCESAGIECTMVEAEVAECNHENSSQHEEPSQ